MHYITTDFQTRTEFTSLESAFEAARSLWLNGEAVCIWICDKENNMVKRIKTSLDL